jgi:hypothetical protein
MISGNYPGAQENTDPQIGRNCQKLSWTHGPFVTFPSSRFVLPSAP